MPSSGSTHPKGSIPLWQDSPGRTAAVKAIVGHPAYTRAELDELDRKHAAEGPPPKVLWTDPMQQLPWALLTPDEVDLLRKQPSAVSPILVDLLATRRGPTEALTIGCDTTEATDAFVRAIEASHERQNWTDCALMALFALRRGLRSARLYLSTSHPISQAVGFREARDFLLEGEDLMSDHHDEAVFRYDLAGIESTLEKLETRRVLP